MAKVKIKYKQMNKQEYLNCKFSVGYVFGHPVDNMYLKLERNGEEPIIILLRTDEMSAINHITAGIIWSEAVGAYYYRESEDISQLCLLCNSPSRDGKPHKECTDYESFKQQEWGK